MNGLIGAGTRAVPGRGNGGSPGVTTIYRCTNAQRLSGTNGTRVFQSGDLARVIDQGHRIEQYLPTVPTLVLGGTLDGWYSARGLDPAFPSRQFYNLIGGPDNSAGADGICTDANHRWVICDHAGSPICYHPANTPEPPSSGWLYAWDSGEHGVDDPADITVTRNDATNEDNWVVLRNTLLVTAAVIGGYASPPLVLAHVQASNDTDTPIGWVYADSVGYDFRAVAAAGYTGINVKALDAGGAALPDQSLPAQAGSFALPSVGLRAAIRLSLFPVA